MMYLQKMRPDERILTRFLISLLFCSRMPEYHSYFPRIHHWSWREIGVRTAVGATPGHITAQITKETLVCALKGGLADIAATSLTNTIVNLCFNQLALSFNTVSLLAGVFLSFMAGLLTSLIQAGKASRLDPIAALREEWWYGKGTEKCKVQSFHLHWNHVRIFRDHDYTVGEFRLCRSKYGNKQWSALLCQCIHSTCRIGNNPRDNRNTVDANSPQTCE